MGKRYLYIILTRTNTVISKLIEFIKQNEYTHAAISFDKELNQMYSFGRRDPYNPFIGRFRKEDINAGVYEFSKTLPGVIIEIEVTNEQYEKAKKLVDHFICNTDLYKYNYMGLLNSLMNRPMCSGNRFLCSEFVYYVLKESSIADHEIPRNLVRPQDLLRIEGKIIYKGNLKDITLFRKLNNLISLPENAQHQSLSIYPSALN